MAVVLRADNQVLVANAEYTYLTQNYASGVSTLNIANTHDFAANDPILVGEIGHSDAEIFKIRTINTGTGDITLLDIDGNSVSTAQAHAESTKVTVLPYNQIKFFWTAALGTLADETPTFNETIPLTAWLELDPASYYTIYEDTAHTTGFGWFQYKNNTTTEVSQESNAIPYAGFSLNTAANVFSDFESLLNVRELKLITLADKFSWLNEALAILRNKLNLTNTEYTVSSTQSISIVSGTVEYELPSDFSDLVEITDGLNTATSSGKAIPFMPVSQILSYNGSTLYYYLRGRYIGFVPTPTASTTYYYRYKALVTRVTSLSTYIILPDNAFYALKDWMMYRAQLKFKNPSATTYYQAFSDQVNLYMQAAVKRYANLDEFGVSATANV